MFDDERDDQHDDEQDGETLVRWSAPRSRQLSYAHRHTVARGGAASDSDEPAAAALGSGIITPPVAYPTQRLERVEQAKLVASCRIVKDTPAALSSAEPAPVVEAPPVVEAMPVVGTAPRFEGPPVSRPELPARPPATRPRLPTPLPVLRHEPRREDRGASARASARPATPRRWRRTALLALLLAVAGGAARHQVAGGAEQVLAAILDR